MTDHRTVRLVIGLVGAVAVLGACVVGVLAYQAKDIPEGLLALATTSLGALGSMLVSTRGGGEPVPVQVQNTDAEPVPVEDAGMTAVDAVLVVCLLVIVLVLLGAVPR